MATAAVTANITAAIPAAFRGNCHNSAYHLRRALVGVQTFTEMVKRFCIAYVRKIAQLHGGDEGEIMVESFWCRMAFGRLPVLFRILFAFLL